MLTRWSRWSATLAALRTARVPATRALGLHRRLPRRLTSTLGAALNPALTFALTFASTFASAFASAFALLLTLMLAVAFSLSAATASARTAPDAEAVWKALRAGGAVVLLRHAQTVPGIGDPPGFRLDDCASQRNLSDEGRAQSARIGEAFRTRGVRIGEVVSSQWCRCMETGMLAFGRVEHWRAADSFFNESARSAAQTAELHKRIASYRGPDTLIVVTHQVNITALTGIFPAMGEAVVLRPAPTAGHRVIGRLSAP